MKKYLTLLLLLPVAIMTVTGAHAQRKNTTSHDVRPAAAAVAEKTDRTCGCDCPCMRERRMPECQHKKKKHRHEKHHQDNNGLSQENTSQN